MVISVQNDERIQKMKEFIQCLMVFKVEPIFYQSMDPENGAFPGDRKSN